MDDDQEIEERAERYEILANETRKAFVEAREEGSFNHELEDEYKANLSTQEDIVEYEKWLDGCYADNPDIGPTPEDYELNERMP